MGRAVIALAASARRRRIAGGLRPARARRPVEQSWRRTLVTAEHALPACEVIIDFSTARPPPRWPGWRRLVAAPALVIGSTGFQPNEDEAAIAEARPRDRHRQVGQLFAWGVNVLAGLVAQAARRLGAEAWDIEILEAHHRRKVRCAVRAPRSCSARRPPAAAA